MKRNAFTHLFYFLNYVIKLQTYNDVIDGSRQKRRN